MQAVVVDGDEIVREAIRWLLRSRLGFDVVFPAGNLKDAQAMLAHAEQMELVVVNQHALGEPPLESLTGLAKDFPRADIVVMANSNTQKDAVECLSAGAVAYIPQSLSINRIAAAIQQVLEGGVFLPRGLSPPQPEPVRRFNRQASGVENITPRQREVLDQLLFGKSSKQIGNALGVSEGTIKIHLAAIYRALGVRSRAQAISKVMSD
jgi:DNA-binding NarL/FixJ family response regulator